jgi:predicted amidohydrolase
LLERQHVGALLREAQTTAVLSTWLGIIRLLLRLPRAWRPGGPAELESPGPLMTQNRLSGCGLRIGACQTPEILGDVEAALACIETFARQPRSDAVDLLLFPECFLQGYLVEPEHISQYALDLTSTSFQKVLDRLLPVRPTLVFGVIEQSGAAYFNTAVVVRRGVLEGFYRKTHLMAGERMFQAGNAYSTFNLNGVTWGINICYDTNFSDAAKAVASQGARVLLVPSQNMMKRQAAEAWKCRHNRVRAERVKETGMWLVSADVTGARDESRIGYGPTSVMNPHAEVVAQVPTMTVDMVVAEIDVRLP